MKDGQTIGQWLKWDFEGNEWLTIYDKNHNRIYLEHRVGFWNKKQFDDKNNEIFHIDDTGYWCKHEYDSKSNLIYFENSGGHIIDNRTPEIIEHNGRKYQLIP